MGAAVEEARTGFPPQATEREPSSDLGRPPARPRKRWSRRRCEVNRGLVRSAVEEAWAVDVAETLESPDVALRSASPARAREVPTGTRGESDAPVARPPVQKAGSPDVTKRRQEHHLRRHGGPLCPGRRTTRAAGREPRSRGACAPIIRRRTKMSRDRDSPHGDDHRFSNGAGQRFRRASAASTARAPPSCARRTTAACDGCRRETDELERVRGSVPPFTATREKKSERDGLLFSRQQTARTAHAPPPFDTPGDCRGRDSGARSPRRFRRGKPRDHPCRNNARAGRQAVATGRSTRSKAGNPTGCT